MERKGAWSSAILFAIVLLVAKVASGQHIVPIENGGFEAGLSGWTRTGSVTAGGDSPALSGTGCAVFSYDNLPVNGRLWQIVEVPADRYCRFNFFIGSINYSSSPVRIEAQVGIQGREQFVVLDSIVVQPAPQNSAAYHYVPATLSASGGGLPLTIVFIDRSTNNGIAADGVVDDVFVWFCDADIDDDGVYANGHIGDGGVDINDLLFFLAAFEAGEPGGGGDLDDGNGQGIPDGGVDINDLLFFLARFEQGC